MNLTSHPWIPVIRADQSPDRVSLNALFAQAEDITDLNLDPPSRIAVMRFLICICQAALDGPEDEAHWARCKAKIPGEALAYLKENANAFYLDEGDHPFLQIPGITFEKGKEAKAVKSIEAIDFRSPHGGSNTPLFQRLNHTEMGTHLLTVMNFSTGGKVGQAKWGKIQSNDPTFAGPCIKALHTFILGETLLDTLHWNLLCKTGSPCGVDQLPNGKWGRPVWETMPASPKDEAAWDNAFTTYLGRLVPLTRLVSLTAAPGRCIFGPLPKAFKMGHLPMFREPSTTVVLSKKQEPFYFSVNSSRHVWRDLESVLALDRKDTSASGAVVLNRLAGQVQENQTVTLWTGGLETGATAAKLSDMVEWNITLPLELLQEDNLAVYTQGMELAQTGEFTLKKGVKTWADDQKLGTSPWPRAQALYWDLLNAQWPRLLEAVEDELPLAQTWYPPVRKAMEAAYTQSCSHDSARQLRAFAKGRDRLKLKKPQC